MSALTAYYEEPLRAYLDCADPSSHGLALATRIERARSLALHTFWFKRSRQMPRSRAALSLLAGLWPAAVLDVGSGRGTNLWPMLEVLANARVTAIERDPATARGLGCVSRGGLARLGVVLADIERLPLQDASFDVACALEVLEHVSDPRAAARELRRVVRRALVASVPLGPDDNPEHHHVFEQGALAELLRSAGFASVKESAVDGHLVALAQVSPAAMPEPTGGKNERSEP